MNYSYNYHKEKPIPYAELLKMAFTDELTGLPNLRSFRACLQERIQQANNTKRTFGLLFIDIDHFKTINDAYGHVLGDKFLIESAKQIAAAAESTVFRKSGDEFLILFKDSSRLEREVQAFQDQLPDVIKIGELRLPLHVSIGYSVYPNHGESEEALLHYANKMMYLNKRKYKLQLNR
ncbi:GGDEF domain-containing protein [Ornithinibacillus sp. JPR2-1]|uniref:GGDEF domain-containing protein n=1 Tax=Ornithinibacillus sp. JPR2-1 TaxID=2094019 RepID=UPI0031E1CE59